MLPSFTSFIITAVLALLAMAFYTLFEQKILAYHQSRKGPNKVGLAGVPQPLADALKLFTKETSSPTLANSKPFILSPIVSLVLALLLWSIMPNHAQAYFMSFGIILFLAISSLSVYATMAAGWSSNSKYALLGALRSIAQTISYEVSMALILISALLFIVSLSFYEPLTGLMVPLITVLSPIFICWFISTLAETNRAPFDFAEGESELVSGFNTEYSGGKFAMIFMAEYASILIMCIFTSTIFCSPALINTFITKTLFASFASISLATAFISIRAAYPRLRYDLLMHYTWKTLLPLSLVTILIIMPIVSLI